MKLSRNFSLEEFTRSETATKQGIKNEPGPEEIKNITYLCTHLLQPLRNIIKEPMNINSGFRCTELNKAVGGVPTSQHVKGEAADVRTSNPRRLLEELKRSGLPFDQAILYPTFMHLSVRQEYGNRYQVLAAKGVVV